MGRKFKILLLILKNFLESHDSQQGSMAPPSAYSSDQLIDSQMTLDPQFLVPTDNTVSSDPTQTTFVYQTSTITFHLKCHPQRIIVIL